MIITLMYLCFYSSKIEDFKDTFITVKKTEIFDKNNFDIIH